MGILADNSHILRQLLLETLPLQLSLPLISLSQRPNPIEYQECEYQTVAPDPPLRKTRLILFSIIPLDHSAKP